MFWNMFTKWEISPKRNAQGPTLSINTKIGRPIGQFWQPLKSLVFLIDLKTEPFQQLAYWKRQIKT